MPVLKPGARLRSSVCDAEFAVVKAPADDVDLRCGGQPMVPVGEDPPAGLSANGFQEGSLIGKRYTDDAATVEVLCTKAGTSSLSLGDEALVLKDAKPLPSSD
ncbi:MAG TPA: hypothetical protein VIR58_08250 [Acidimicrobiales bacterium]